MSRTHWRQTRAQPGARHRDSCAHARQTHRDEFFREALWSAWLQLLIVAMLAMGLAPLVAPELVLQGVSLLVYADPAVLGCTGAPVRGYLFFVHAVMGALMTRWAASLLLLVRRAYARGSRSAWRAVALSVLAWFVPGTLFSLQAGVWLNVAVNLLVLAFFAAPLVATLRACRR